MISPTLSIVIPVYNASKSITAISSQILAQSFHDFELILVDDGSTDNTINVLRGIAKSDKRVIVRSKKNGGPSSARNSGLDKAQGKYVMFCDADDAIDGSIFVTMIREIEDSAADIVISGWQVDVRTNKKLLRNYKTISPDRESIYGSEVERKTRIMQSIGENGQLYNLWNKIFRRDIIENHNLRFREDIHFGEDLIFSLQYFQYANKIELIPDALYHYQTNSATSLFSTSALVPEYRHENYRALELFFDNSDDPKLHALYNWVRWRWLLSFHLVVSRADIPYSQKIHLIQQVKLSNPRITSSRYIGFKHWLIECILSISHRSPHLSLLLASTVNFMKQSVIKIKSLL